ncbi:Uncharacterised protein [Legionella pneumophila]|nr:Uncharacterised protein [Legionella pneumophila]
MLLRMEPPAKGMIKCVLNIRLRHLHLSLKLLLPGELGILNQDRKQLCMLKRMALRYQ